MSFIHYVIGINYSLYFAFQCVFNVDKHKGLMLTELAENVTVKDIKTSTGCSFSVADNITTMGQ